jgi:hypothetical protein
MKKPATSRGATKHNALTNIFFAAAFALLEVSTTLAQAPSVPLPLPAPTQTQAPGPTQTPSQTVPPLPAPPQPSRDYDLDGQASVFAGAGAQVSNRQSLAAWQLGATIGIVVPNTYFGMSFEGGYVGPWSRPRAGSAIFSANYVSQWDSSARSRFKPFLTVGYTRLFGTGNAVNYGAGFDYHLDASHAIRIEVRDYYSPTDQIQHNVAVRIGFVKLGAIMD